MYIMERSRNPMMAPVITGMVLARRRRYWNSIRSQIKGIFRLRGELTCTVCGAEERLEIHHIIPLSLNGSNDISNLMVLCHDHHMAVHHDDLDLGVSGKQMKY